MTAEVDVAAFGALVSDRTRAAILTTLLNGARVSASVLAERAGVRRNLASAHLKRLRDGGLVAVEQRGRRRLYRLAGQQVADALEAIMLAAPMSAVSSLRQSREREWLHEARLCYDHLAGRMGVALSEGLVAQGLLTDSPSGYLVSPRGAVAFRHLGIDLAALRESPRPLTRACADRTQGRHHLAGSLGAALTTEIVRRDWIQTSETTRVVRLTDVGRAALRDELGVDLGKESPTASAGTYESSAFAAAAH